MIAVALVIGGIVFLLTRYALFGALATALAFALTPMVLKAVSMRRMARFEAQLPDALELMAAALRAGHGFQRALQVTAEDMPHPISDEFQIAVQDIGAGRTVEDALHGILQRVPSYEMELIATAVAIQMQVGGNLSEILTKIADTLRERARIKGEIATLTAEGRLSAWILLLAPLAMFLFMYTRNPDYMAPLVKEEMGHYMLAGAGIMQIIGMVIIWRMLAMEV
jgi:tight adherence protein B